MPEPKTIECWCTGCRKSTPHVFSGLMTGLWRFLCSKCGRGKLMTEREAKA